MAGARFTPSLFDKLTSGIEPAGDDGVERDSRAGPFRFYTVPRIDRYGERAIRDVLRRDLQWLFNTTNMAGSVDLSSVPQVQQSVLNFGVADLAGKTGTRRVIEQRARDLRTAIRTFEPRLDPDLLDVEATAIPERENAVTYLVRSELTSPVEPLAVQYKTDVEVDTGAAAVRD